MWQYFFISACSIILTLFIVFLVLRNRKPKTIVIEKERPKMNTVKKWSYRQNLGFKTTWGRYYTEYSLAINNLLEDSYQGNVTVLALPVLFLIRHSLELAFKMNLIDLQQLSGENATIDYSGKTAHVLHKLHDEFERQVHLIFAKEKISAIIVKDFNKRNDELRNFRKIFDQLDNWSYAFRYPVKNDGMTKSFDKNDEINIANIIPIYRETEIILKYTIDVLTDPASKSK